MPSTGAFRAFRSRRSLPSLSLAVAALAAAAASGCDSSSDKSTPDGGGAGDPAALKNTVEPAAAAGSFNPLVATVNAAELPATLESPGPFTVFAPTDAAFAALPAGTVDNLLKPEN